MDFIYFDCPHLPLQCGCVCTKCRSTRFGGESMRKSPRLKLKNSLISTHYHRPQTKLPEGNVFTSVCHSVLRG